MSHGMGYEDIHDPEHETWERCEGKAIISKVGLNKRSKCDIIWIRLGTYYRLR